MGFGHCRPPARGNVVEDHGRGAGYPQIPAMPRFARHGCKDVPARFVAMEQLLPHLAGTQRLHDRLEEGREFPSPFRHRPLRERHPMMPPRLAASARRTAIEVLVEHDLRPDRHPQGAFGEQPRRRGSRHQARNLGTATPLGVALALDATPMSLALDFDFGPACGDWSTWTLPHGWDTSIVHSGCRRDAAAGHESWPDGLRCPPSALFPAPPAARTALASSALAM
jgi:hypothetical protein